MPAHSGHTSSMLGDNQLEDAIVTVAIVLHDDDIDILSIRRLATARSFVMLADPI